MATAVVFGAGNVGRGFIGQVFSEAGLEVVFADVSEQVIAALNSARSYRHVTVDNDTRTETVISPVRAIRADDPAAVTAQLRTASVAATCVGARALPGLCASIAPALLDRAQASRPPLNLLLAENLHDPIPKVRAWLQQAEPGLTDELLDAQLGLVSTSIGRMIPAPDVSSLTLDPTIIQAEPYKYLPIDGQAIKGEFPPLPAAVVDPNAPFSFYVDRKLYVHNMGHAMSAYLGTLLGDTYIWQTIARPQVRSFVCAAMIESAAALAAAYKRPMGPLLDHIDDLVHRFGNRALGDTVERVGRDPRRKLSRSDRLLGAHALCLTHDVRPRRISLGIAAGLHQLATVDNLDEAEAIAFLDAQGFTAEPESRQLLLDQYKQFADGASLDQQDELLDQLFRVPQIA